MRFFDKAAELAACGFQVFPVRHGDHRGILRNSATDDLAALSLLDKRMPHDDVAVLLGERSNLMLLEIECGRGFAELRALEAAGQHLPECPISIADNGDAFAWLRNVSGGRGHWTVAPGLTVRGEGGFELAPPAVDALRGRLSWFRPPWDVRPPAAPAWLVSRIFPAPVRGTFRNYATTRGPA